MQTLLLPKDLPQIFILNLSKIQNPIEFIEDEKVCNLWRKINEILYDSDLSILERARIVVIFNKGLMEMGINSSVDVGYIVVDDNHSYVKYMINIGEKIICPDFGFEDSCNKINFGYGGGLDRYKKHKEEIMILSNQDNWQFSSIACLSVAFIVSNDSKYCSGFQCVSPGTFKCGRCKKVRYCSKECQKNSWKDHKQKCHSV